MGKKKHLAAVRGPRMADAADRHVLYQKSVQDPEMEVALLAEKFQALRGRAPVSLREDFCGTAYLCVEWCRSDAGRTAVGVDLSQEALDWGRARNVDPAGDAVANRITLLHGDVLDTPSEPVDIVCAFNFSYNGFKSRDQLRRYFQAARTQLGPEGVMVMDVYGGQEAIDAMSEDREVDDEDFTYVWEQETFNPITNDTVCHIHFEFPDGSRLERAFTYDWRLWSLPELRELLAEAGFSAVHVFWEEFEDQDDEDDEYLDSTGRYYETTEVENQESWICYLVAER